MLFIRSGVYYPRTRLRGGALGRLELVHTHEKW
jgi:hypothetical protein